MRKVFQLNDQNDIEVLGSTEEHPHFYVGKIVEIDSTHYVINEIRDDDLGKPLYVKPILLNAEPVNMVGVDLACPYCLAVWSDSILGAVNDTIVDCDECSGVSHVQRILDCQVKLDSMDNQEVDIIYIIMPKIAGEILHIAVQR